MGIAVGIFNINVFKKSMWWFLWISSAVPSNHRYLLTRYRETSVSERNSVDQELLQCGKSKLCRSINISILFLSLHLQTMCDFMQRLITLGTRNYNTWKIICCSCILTVNRCLSKLSVSLYWDFLVVGSNLFKLKMSKNDLDKWAQCLFFLHKESNNLTFAEFAWRPK